MAIAILKPKYKIPQKASYNRLAPRRRYEIDLIPCAVCGSDPLRMTHWRVNLGAPERQYDYVQCQKCRLTTERHDSIWKAEEAWNKAQAERDYRYRINAL